MQGCADARRDSRTVGHPLVGLASQAGAGKELEALTAEERGQGQANALTTASVGKEGIEGYWWGKRTHKSPRGGQALLSSN